jgi:nucleotide-binding universal stress UspA family protein
MLRSIVVPLDGSAFSEHALPLACSLARQSGAILHLLHIHQPPPPIPAAGFEMVDLYDKRLREDELAYLADVKRRIDAAGDVVTKTALRGDGDVVRSVRDYAEEFAADQMVMATHGRGALGRWWFGSVADELARTMPRPVVLVRPGEGEADVTRRPQLKSIVVALDGTGLAEQIVEPVIRMGEPFGATFALVRVCPPVIRTSYLPEGTTIQGLDNGELEHLSALQRKALGECKDYLDAVAARFTASGLRCTTHAPVEEEPAYGILGIARAQSAGLIAMETHGRRGLSRLFLGSVAEKVVRGAEVPVLMNRPAV